MPTISQGALLGALRFPGKGSDRRGQTIKPGAYTLRYSLQPVNGDHQGVAPQRDFLVLVPAADDTKPGDIPNIDDLMKMSRKASGTPHPAVLSMSSSSNAAFPELKKEGDSDWALHAKIGDTAVAVIVIAVAGLCCRGAGRAGLRDPTDTRRHGVLARADPARDVRQVVGGAVAVVVQSVTDLCSRRTVRSGGNAQPLRLFHAQFVRAELIAPDLRGWRCRIAWARRLVADHVAGEGIAAAARNGGKVRLDDRLRDRRAQ